VTGHTTPGWTASPWPAANRPVVQVGCELQRDWGRQETAEGFTQILFGGERPLAGASTEPAGNGVRAGR